jgi:hypothetical protein
MSAYDRAVGGKLNLKGAVPLLKQELKKKKKKKKVKAPDEGEEGVEGPAEGLEGPSEGAEGTELVVAKKEGAAKEVKKGKTSFSRFPRIHVVPAFFCLACKQIENSSGGYFDTFAD